MIAAKWINEPVVVHMSLASYKLNTFDQHKPKRMKRNVFNRRIKCVICAERQAMPWHRRTVPIAKALLLLLARPRIIRMQLSINYNNFCFRPAQNPFALHSATHCMDAEKNANERNRAYGIDTGFSATCFRLSEFSEYIYIFGYHLGVPSRPCFSCSHRLKIPKWKFMEFAKSKQETMKSIWKNGQWTPEWVMFGTELKKKCRGLSIGEFLSRINLQESQMQLRN